MTSAKPHTLSAPDQAMDVLHTELDPSITRRAPRGVACVQACTLTGRPLRSIFAIDRFPILASVTNEPAEDDLFYRLEIAIEPTLGLVQQRYLPPPDVLYANARNSAMGAVWQRHFTAFRSFVERYGALGAESRIAEIGSGNGALARQFATVESVTCYEPAPAFAATGNLRLVREFFSGELDDDAAPYDCIFASHTLEHCNTPRDLLRAVHDRLSRGGVACFSVPNVAVALSERQVNCFNPEHSLYFTPESLAYALRYSGFTDCVIETFENHSVFIAARKGSGRIAMPDTGADFARSKALRAAVSDYASAMREAGSQVQRLLAPHQGKPCYIFGAHMMSAIVFHMMGVPESVFSAVLDNDPLKSGLRLYGTSLSCHHPENVSLNGAVVLLNGGVYHDEIREPLARLGAQVVEWGQGSGITG